MLNFQKSFQDLAFLLWLSSLDDSAVAKLYEVLSAYMEVRGLFQEEEENDEIVIRPNRN